MTLPTSKMSLAFKILGLALLWALLLPSSLMATTYYVDYTNGNDANNGTSKTTAWKYAPGMYSCSATCNSTTLKPGDSVIFRGCQTWHNESFPWIPQFNGSSSAQIYYGVDETWWDSTVSGCSTAWNRPILNPDAEDISHNNTYLEQLVYVGNSSYQTFDNFEVTNVLDNDGYLNDEVTLFDFGAPGGPGNIVENCYIHGWVSPYFSVGTGNIAANSSTVTNFVPYSYSPSPASSWATLNAPVGVQVIPQGSYWPVQSGAPLATSITGSNPYTIATNSSTVGTACNGCVVQIGMGYLSVFAGVEGQCTGCIAQNNVVDGSDSSVAQLNPYPDCGVSEGNNNFCATSGYAGWRLPNIWRNNVVRYVDNAFVGECSEFSGNLIEYLRLGPNPTDHTNGIECVDETPSNNLYYNNVVRHLNWNNASAPSGQGSVGVSVMPAPQSGYTSYAFNNVTYDMLQNAMWEPSFGTNCCGSLVLFNDTADGGPSWTSENYDFSTTCPSSYTSCKYENNHLISNIGSSSVLTAGNCGSNCTDTTNLVQSISVANGQGYTSSETYAYSPISGGSTIGAGTNLSSLCSTISSINAAAGTACLSDTNYGALYNTSNHTVTVGARTVVARPGSTAWDIGAYEYAATSPPNAPASLTATPH